MTMKIYILEDNVIFVQEFLRRLIQRKYMFSTCYTVEDYVFEEADLYIVDLQLGNNFSYEVIKDIKSKTDKKIIALTHHVHNEDVITKAKEAGIDYVMDKQDYETYFIQIDTILSMK